VDDPESSLEERPTQAASAPALFVELTAAPASGVYAIRLVTTDNRTVGAGACRVTAGSGAYGRTIDLAVSAIRRVELVEPGSPTLVASLR